MNVRLSLGAEWNTGQGMRRTAGWCMVFLGIAGFTQIAATAESTSATRTTLTVATNNAGSRTRATLAAHVDVPDAAGAPSGVVTFRTSDHAREMDRGGEMDLGSAFLDGEGNASLQTDSLSAGKHQIVAVYAGQSSYLTSTSKPERVEANVSAVAGFTVAAAPTSLSTTVGGFVNSVVTVTPANGFNAYVSLSCKGLPINATCSFTPVSVPASCSTSASGAQTCAAGSSVMQIQTLSPTVAGALRNDEPSGMRRYAFVFPALFGLAGLGACKRRGWRNLTLALLAFAGAMGMTACSQRYNYLNHGPPGNTGTPIGSYTVTIEAESSTGSQTTTPPVQPQITLVITAAKS